MTGVDKTTIELYFEHCEHPILLPDGFEEAFLGVGYQFGRPEVACYDYNKCIDILMERDGMTYDEAIEFFEYNVIGYGGEGVPIFVDRSGFLEIESKPKIMQFIKG